MSDVRSLLKQTRQSRRITHPYAKYSSQGALYCTACSQKIASEALWETPISSTSHKEKVKDVIRESQRKAKRGIAATAMEDELQQEEQESRKRVKIQDPEPQKETEDDVIESTEIQETVKEGLPEDFFDEGSKPAKTGVDEDEWIRFQADIADTIRNQEERDQEDEEEMRRGIVEEFEELNTLEDRVARLKQRRAEFLATKDEKPVPMAADNNTADEDDEAEEEEWW